MFEYDKRFDVYGEQFVFYDYNEPLELPNHTTSSFDYIVLDPPFLSEECIAKVAQTIQAIAKPGCKMVLMTGLWSILWQVLLVVNIVLCRQGSAR